MLWRIAKESLSPRQLAQWKVGENEFPDARARFIMEQVLETGEYIPEVLRVPPDYEGIYISGNLDLEQFPIFYEAGFHELNNRSTLGLLPLGYGNTDNFFGAISGALETALLQRQTFSWMKNHSYLDQPMTDLQSLGGNTSATGWHFMALNLLYVLPSDWTRTSTLDLIHQFFYDFLGSRSRDSCECWCSPHGCLPCTMWLKYWGVKDERLRNRGRHSLPYQGQLDHLLMLENASRQVSTEILTYLTFEALEMTHTCCIIESLFQVPWLGSSRFFIKQFLGNVREIQDEEEELGARLEHLVREFQSKLESSQHSLREFIYGYWSRRMAEECLPNHDNMEAIQEAGVNIDETCKSSNILHGSSLIPRQDQTPIALLSLLRSDFDFKNYS